MASSVSLAPRTRHFLATITDSSGTESPNGFDSGYTGLPVPETDYYALFRTWLAPEMPRPGCVWSHVLLIELTDLAHIPSLSVLRKLCRRPSVSSQQKFGEYAKELALESVVDAQPVPVDRRRASVLVSSLYEQPASSVVVLDEMCSPWENIVFRIWSQQWPRLQRNFTFSTSSLGDRRLAGVNFDLQIAPIRSQRLWRTGLPLILIMDMTREITEASLFPSWMSLVLDDLGEREKSELRKFLFAYGSDIERPRHAFLQLVKAYISLNSCRNWEDQLRSIASIFPKESKALRLKEYLVTPNQPSNEMPRFDREWTTAAFLLGAPEAKAYTKISFDHAGLAPLLWQQKREEVLALLARLVRRDENPSAMAFAKAVGKCITPDELRDIAFIHPELISVFISQRAELAYEVGTWELPGYVQSQIFELLERHPLNQEEWGKIMGAMFLAATYVSIKSAVRNSGIYAMHGAFRWLSHDISKTKLPSSSWREALIEPATQQLVGRPPLPPAELAFCSWIVPPEIVLRELSAERKDILELAGRALEDLPKPLRSHTAFALVALGLRSKTVEGVRLIKRGYFEAYEILANTQATSEEWALLSAEVPRIGRWNDWDRCEKLRRAVREWLLKHARSANPLKEAAASPQQEAVASQVYDPDNQPNENDEFID